MEDLNLLLLAVFVCTMLEVSPRTWDARWIELDD